MEKKIYELSTQVDTNDADYIEMTSRVSQEDIDRLVPILNRIKEKHPNNRHNWENDSNAEEIHKKMYPEIPVEDLEFLSDFLPYGEYGFHSIESVEYYPLPEKIRLI